MARHQRGDEDAALGKFKEAYQAFPRPNTLMAIAREEHLLGLCVAAVRHYREALGNAMLHPENRVLAREYVAELEGSVGRLFVRGPSGARVEVDGQRRQLPLEEAIDVPAGKVLNVTASHEGVALEATVTVQAGYLATVSLRPVASARASAESTPNEDARAPLPATTTSVVGQSGVLQPRIVVPATLGFLALGAASTAIVFAVGSRSSERAAERFHDSGACASPSAACDEVRGHADDARRESAFSRGFYVGAGLLAASALVSWFVWPSPKPAGVRVQPTVDLHPAAFKLNIPF